FRQALGHQPVRVEFAHQIAVPGPDRLMAQGLPEEAIEVATEKLARINAAWDRVRREHGA
ncbi:MAG TPA: hypothetical protein VKA18_00035, partial [Alphaproteobacteria bacterium]|nr:hypothetical protein [Alphaproteobacteria bacterium]